MSYITDSNDVNFGFRFHEFQLYNHTQYLGTARIIKVRFKFINSIT